jgi:hypothetical protein
MNPLLFVWIPLPVCMGERAVVPWNAGRLTLTPSGWALTKLSHELSQAFPCCSAHSTNSPDSDAMALTAEIESATQSTDTAESAKRIVLSLQVAVFL